MAFWLWILVAFVVVILFVLVSNVRIRFRYSRSEGDQLGQVVVIVHGLYGLFRYRIDLPSISIRGRNIVFREKGTGELMGRHAEQQKKKRIGKAKIRKYFHSYLKILHSTRHFLDWLKVTMKKVECTRWRLDFRVGTGDAPTTALMTGLLWTVSGCASAAAGHFVRLKTSPQSQIVPNYSQTEFSMVWEADFRIRITAAVGSLLKLRRLKKDA